MLLLIKYAGHTTYVAGGGKVSEMEGLEGISV
jgi:hypothetical protein